jgi:hypothetical protein
MFSFVQTLSFDNSCHSDNEQKVHEFSNGSESYCFIELQNQKYTIIDKHYMKDVMKYNWFINKIGYIMHQKRVKETEIKNTQLALHFLVKKLQSGDPDFKIDKHVTSIDHINRQPFDNRVSNLRIATNREQSENQKMRSNRHTPIDALQTIGITEYPRHIRYDGSEERFLIENSHPELQYTKKRMNGTRKGSIIERYFHVLHLGYELDQEWLKRKTLSNTITFEGSQLEERNKCIKLVEAFNTHFLEEEIIPIDDIYEAFASASTYKTQIDLLLQNEELGLKDPNILHEEKGFVLTKKIMKQLPKHLYFKPPTKTRGCGFEYDFKHPETKVRLNTRLTASKAISLEEKFKIALQFDYDTYKRNLK